MRNAVPADQRRALRLAISGSGRFYHEWRVGLGSSGTERHFAASACSFAQYYDPSCGSEVGTRMAEVVKFYVWAVPSFGANLFPDHTWVTTYNSRAIRYGNIKHVIAAKEFFWYCWGNFYPQGGTPINKSGFLGERAGDLALSKCLVEPNAESQRVRKARGTIFTYGRNGVCHQLANQVLYATANGGAPLTVSKARGYSASSFFYGTWTCPGLVDS
jgi:hypothetical protein